MNAAEVISYCVDDAKFQKIDQMNELRKNFETDPKELKSLDHMNNQPKAFRQDNLQ